MKNILSFSVIVYLLLFLACSHTNSTRRSLADESLKREDLRVDRRAEQTYDTFYGNASFYAGKFHGRQTASGEIYDMYQLTAAHRTLPFGTVCRVTNLENKRSVTVRVNDRGPFVDGRVMDLSLEAANQLGSIQDGVIRVRVEILSYPDAGE